MRISKIKITNFRGLADFEIPLSRFGCIIGENNAGKSSAFQAINTFLRASAIEPTDFLDSEKSVRIEISFFDVTPEDLLRISDEKHRERIAEEVRGERISFVRLYDAPGKGKLFVNSKVPRDSRLTELAIEETMKSGLPPETVQANVKATYPEFFRNSGAKATKTALRRMVKEMVSALGEDDLRDGEREIPTGLDRSVYSLLPEVIYIPAVKELNDDLKPGTTSTFGKLVTLLFGRIEHKLPSLESSFESLRKQLNVVEMEGREVDDRLQEVRDIEEVIGRNLQEAFPRTRVRLEIPPPRLRSLLDQAVISIDDGIAGGVRTKGDGLRRSITFAMLRAYAELSVSKSPEKTHVSRPCLLLFEEPEVFLHPRAQQQLFDALKVFSDFNDVLVTTHSPAFYAPHTTGTFVKILKDYTKNPPVGRACVIDLDEIAARDQFEIIKHENNEAAFFADSILLVEGPSDHVVVSHIARTLDPAWDFGKRGVAIAKVNGKGSIARYRKFFAKFDMQVSVLTDLDAVLNGFSKLGASQECADMQSKLVEMVILRTQENNERVDGKTLNSMRTRGDVHSLWDRACEKQAKYAQGECSWEELSESVDAFFGRAQSRGRLEKLKAASEDDLNELKTELIESLRKERIFVWERGAIEDYYPQYIREKSDNKHVQARYFCDQYVTREDLRSLLGARENELCEFERIFGKFFDS
ncbi:ATP-dependent nuclease [Embleya sp. NPDC127516]|uniref:ATP-dependent nuclease n=1 Tax=Embleya sp. NPDC127516 TaxID=3363990 RepID=UPI003828B0CD